MGFSVAQVRPAMWRVGEKRELEESTPSMEVVAVKSELLDERDLQHSGQSPKL